MVEAGEAAEAALHRNLFFVNKISIIEKSIALFGQQCFLFFVYYQD